MQVDAFTNCCKVSFSEQTQAKIEAKIRNLPETDTSDAGAEVMRKSTIAMFLLMCGAVFTLLAGPFFFIAQFVHVGMVISQVNYDRSNKLRLGLKMMGLHVSFPRVSTVYKYSTGHTLLALNVLNRSTVCTRWKSINHCTWNRNTNVFLYKHQFLRVALHFLLTGTDYDFIRNVHHNISSWNNQFEYP